MATPERRPRTSGSRTLWISVDEVAASLQVHRGTLYRWLDQGLIPQPRRIGGRTLWSRADVELFAECSSMAEFQRLKRQRAEK